MANVSAFGCQITLLHRKMPSKTNNVKNYTKSYTPLFIYVLQNIQKWSLEMNKKVIHINSFLEH